ncbi:hypothetical protein ACWD5R_41505 [Streptomyces sp. NPDC002514]|uniref:hypothetical protein n=1 Tax=unclassified Streptomyces TaxID=2593676 RepID=UPI0036BFEFAB
MASEPTSSRAASAVPRLRALLVLSLAVAAVSAMVTVNSVVYVREYLGRDAADVSLALDAYGGGSMSWRCCCPRPSTGSPTGR